MALDLEHERGRATLARLIEAADVLVTNQRPDRERQLGTDAASIAPRAPLLVKLSMSAYGADGPLRNLPAIDASVQALSGLAMARGGGVRPAGFIGAMLDSTSGYLGALGVLAALVRRTRERRGLLVSTSLLNMAALFQVTSLVEPSRLARPRLDEGRNGYGACQRLYRTADGWVCLAARTEADARRLLDALQVGADDVQGALLAAPVDGVLAGRIAAAIRGMPSAALLEACAGAGFEACAEVRRLSSWATSTPPFVAVEQPPFGTLRQVGPLVGAASARTETLRGAPAAISLGGVEALREWGIGEEQLGRLVDEHVVVAEPVEVPARAVNL